MKKTLLEKGILRSKTVGKLEIVLILQYKSFKIKTFTYKGSEWVLLKERQFVDCEAANRSFGRIR